MRAHKNYAIFYECFLVLKELYHKPWKNQYMLGLEVVKWVGHLVYSIKLTWIQSQHSIWSHTPPVVIPEYKTSSNP